MNCWVGLYWVWRPTWKGYKNTFLLTLCVDINLRFAEKIFALHLLDWNLFKYVANFPSPMSSQNSVNYVTKPFHLHLMLRLGTSELQLTPPCAFVACTGTVLCTFVLWDSVFQRLQLKVPLMCICNYPYQLWGSLKPPIEWAPRALSLRVKWFVYEAGLSTPHPPIWCRG
jgi:hypothetical protein